MFKNSKYCCLVIFTLMCGFHTRGQSIEWSQPQKVEKRANITEVIGRNEGGIYVLKKSYRDEERNILVERYSESLRKLSSHLYLTGKNDYYALLTAYKDGLHLFYANYNKDSKEYDLLVKRLDFSLNEEGPDSLLFSIPANAVNERFLQVFKQKNSPDILFTYTKQGNDIPSSFSYLLMDSSLHKLSAGDFDINVEFSYDIQDAVFSRSHVALLVKEEVKHKLNKQGFRYHIYDGMLGQKELADTKLYNDSLVVTDGVMKTDFIHKSFLFSGIYGNSDSTYSKGYCLWRKGWNNAAPLFLMRDFSKQLIDEMSGKVSKVDGIYYLKAGDIVLRQDGGVILTCEEFQETREMVFDMNMGNPVSQSNYRYYYYYNNLLVLSMDTAANLSWHAIPKKDQISINDQGLYSSYLLSVMPNKIYYVYNDLSRKNWSLNIYEISENGTTSNNVLIKSQDYDGRLIPQQGEQIGFNSVLIPGYNHDGLVLMKLGF